MKKRGYIDLNNKLFYYTRQAFKNISNRRIMSFASVCIVTSSLLLLGFFLSVSLNISSFLDRLGNSKEINVYLSNNTEKTIISEIEDSLKEINGVESVRFLSKEDRMKKTIEELFDEEYEPEIDSNPLRNSFIVSISDTSMLTDICSAISDIKGVEEVIKNNDVIIGINSLTKVINNLGIWMNILFILFAVFIVSASVKAGISAHSEEISIMKIIGATNGFIATPFLIQGLILGLFSATVASILILIGYGIVIDNITTFLPSEIFSFLSLRNLSVVLVPAFYIIGSVVGIVGSFTSVKKYLKN